MKEANLSYTQGEGYRGPPNQFPYEGLVHPIPLDLCAADWGDVWPRNPFSENFCKEGSTLLR